MARFDVLWGVRVINSDGVFMICALKCTVMLVVIICVLKCAVLDCTAIGCRLC